MSIATEYRHQLLIVGGPLNGSLALDDGAKKLIVSRNEKQDGENVQRLYIYRRRNFSNPVTGLSISAWVYPEVSRQDATAIVKAYCRRA